MAQEMKCKRCQCEFQPKYSDEYCKRRCEYDERIAQRFAKGFNFTKGMRKYLLKMRGERCETCSVQTWNEQPLAFQVDHINGDRQDNRFENLRILCPNCHSQTPTWGHKNASKEGKERMLAGIIQ